MKLTDFEPARNRDQWQSPGILSPLTHKQRRTNDMSFTSQLTEKLKNVTTRK
jgi:hypothetical protein